MSSDVPPEIAEHDYASNPTKDISKMSTESSSTDSSSSDFESSSTSDTEIETKRTRAPPERHVDSYATSTPKSSPRSKIKRASTSAGRKDKKPIRKSLRGTDTTEERHYHAPLRQTPCKNCDGCNREDCGTCVYCKDKVKFGGPGRKKQKCAFRACEKMVPRWKDGMKKAAVILSATPDKQKSFSATPSKQKSSDNTPSQSDKSPPLKQSKLTDALPKQSSTPTTFMTSSALPTKSVTLALTSNIAKHVQALITTKSTTTPSTSPASGPSVSTVQSGTVTATSEKPSHKKYSMATSNSAKPLPKKTVLATSISSKPLPKKATTTKITSTTKASSVTNTSEGPAMTAKFIKEIVSFKDKSPGSGGGVTAKIIKAIASHSKTEDKASGGSSAGTKKASPKLNTTVTPTASFKTATGWEMKMKCIQCNRERNLSMARTDKFCGQRCVVKWLEEHPDKTPRDAVGDSEAPLFSLPALTTSESAGAKQEAKEAKPNKPLPRALKQLQIDMAAPGTRLQLSESEDSDDEMPTKKGKSRPTQPASVTAKRSVVNPQPPAIKKVKTIEKTGSISPSNGSKSVKFDLNANSISSITTPPPVPFSQSSGLPGSISIVPLDRLAQFVKEQQRNFDTPTSAVSVEIKLPKGLSASVRDWTVDDVCTYFKSTKECAEFATIFKEQEVDGFALLQLTDDRMCRCLGLKLGKVIKAMAHVDELKKL